MSDSETLIKVEHVSKKFCRSFKKSLWYGLKDMAAELTGGSRSHDQLREDEFWAVKDVSFEVRRGECFGLIGRNGAGKTTLLKMLNGLVKPDHGRIEIRGRIGALIALGAGFNPILSGRENIYINGSILGLTKREIDEKIDDIIDFADIREAIDAPVRSYSSGMNVRLGFAVATAVAPDVLLIDEVLAVGDTDFRTKCYDRLEAIREDVAIILVSHNRNDIVRMCNKAVLFSSGQLAFSGDVIGCFNAYETTMATGAGFVRCHPGYRFSYATLDRNQIESGDPVVLKVGVVADADTRDISFRMSILDVAELAVAEWRSEHHGAPLHLTRGENHFEFNIDAVRLKSGSYFCNFIFSQAGTAQYLLLSFRQQHLLVAGATDGFAHYQL